MLALNEIRHRTVQFLLIVAIIALIGYLVVMISGLGVGLQEQSGSWVRELPVDAVVYNGNANYSLLRSEISPQQLAAVQAAPGVRAVAPLGFFSVTTFRDDRQYPATLIGYDHGSLGAPRIVEGRAVAPEERDAIVADRRYLRRAGLAVGDTVQLTVRLETRTLRITGAVNAGNFFFQPSLFTNRETWQQLRYGAEGANVPAGNVVLADGEVVPRMLEDAVRGIRALSPYDAFFKIEGVAAQQQTVRSLQIMGFVIGGMVIGIFFYVLTLQKVPHIGILKALGASGWFVFRQLLLQVVLLTLAGLAVAIPLALATAALIPDDGVPVAFTGATYGYTALGLLLAAMLGALFSGRQVAKVDPIIALGQQQ